MFGSQNTYVTQFEKAKEHFGQVNTTKAIVQPKYNDQAKTR